MTHPAEGLTAAQLEAIRDLAAIGATVEEMAAVLDVEESALRTTEVRLIVQAGQASLRDSIVAGLRTLTGNRTAKRLVRKLERVKAGGR